MTFESITARNMSEGFHVIFVYVNDITGGLFIRLLLLSIYLIICARLYMTQIKTIGKGDFPMATAVAGFATSIIAVFLRLVPGLVDRYTMSVVIIVTILSILWLFIAKE